MTPMMPATTPAADRRWLPAVVLVGAVYLVVGIVFAALAGSAAANPTRVAWRLAAWLSSAAAFAAHIAYEHRRLRESPRTAAGHVALAVALGAFALAAAANVRSLSVASTPRPLLLVALVAWPVLTAVPAFLVAWAAAAVLARTRRVS